MKDISERKDHFRFIRQTIEERGVNIKIHYGSVHPEDNNLYRAKWCRLTTSKEFKDGIENEEADQRLYNKNGNTLITLDMDKMYYISDSSKCHQDSTRPIILHLIVEKRTFPPELQNLVKADGSIKLKELESWNPLWMDSNWHLASTVYGAFAGLDTDLRALATNTHEQVKHRRKCKRSNIRNALQPSVNISQVRPDLQGNIGPISNIKKGQAHQNARDSLIAGRNYMFDFYVNVLSVIFKGEVQKWRELAYGRGISLEGVSRTTICGFCQDGYSAMLHLDADDPSHTYGLRFFRPASLFSTEYQMVLPTVSINGKKGLVLGQDTGSITVWAGIKLMHSNSLGIEKTLGKGMAPGMVIVQKPRTFSKTHNLEEESSDGLGSQFAGDRKELEKGYRTGGRFG